MKKIIFTFAFLYISIIFTNIYGANKVLDYGFEDWTGDANTTPGYIFTSTYSSYWSDHENGSEVTASFGSNTAHSGTYYFHLNFFVGAVDPCLGTQPTSITPRNRVGLNGAYPSNPNRLCDTDFSTNITSNTICVRFWFRLTDTWKTQVKTTGGSMGNWKMFRLYGAGAGDSSSAFVHLLAGDNTNTPFAIYDPSTASWQNGYAGVDLQDGNWHSMTVVVVRNNDTGATGNITTSVWWDDWYMINSPQGIRTVTCSSYGDHFGYLALFSNFSATYPSSSMGLDLDDIEIWDGVQETDVSPPASPTGLIIRKPF